VTLDSSDWIAIVAVVIAGLSFALAVPSLVIAIRADRRKGRAEVRELAEAARRGEGRIEVDPLPSRRRADGRTSVRGRASNLGPGIAYGVHGWLVDADGKQVSTRSDEYRTLGLAPGDEPRELRVVVNSEVVELGLDRVRWHVVHRDQDQQPHERTTGTYAESPPE
jgi:hypothetical protein